MGDRILCAMSGGVDSSTAAGLLVEAGHEVVGVTLHLSDTPASKRSGRCCAAEDVEDARRVARHLKIPHYTLDYRELFRRTVIDPFVASYVAGRTPTPCTSCNDAVKIAPLVGLANRLGMDALATGHYARVDRSGDRPVLRRAVDPDKDQSYFLFPATPDVLERVLFPLGDRKKADVRAEARRLGLPVAQKPESMEVCFAANGAAAFVESERPALGGGEIVDETGEAIGRHRGVHRFTVGQRRGLPATGGKRLYVLSIDARAGRIVAGNAEALDRAGLVAEDVRWHGDAPIDPFPAEVQVRHRAAATPAEVVPSPAGATVRFRSPQRAVAPGQAAVFYQGDRVVGGGWIAAATACVALYTLAGCDVGAGEGEVKGTVHIPACDLEGPFDLRADFFAAEAFEDSLIVRLQHGGDYLQYADGLVLGVADRSEVAGRLDEPIAIVAPDPESSSPDTPLVRASLYLGALCDDPVGLTAQSGSVTFTSMYTDATDRIAGTFELHLTGGEEAAADLAGDFRLDYERGRPAQRYP